MFAKDKEKVADAVCSCKVRTERERKEKVLKGKRVISTVHGD